MTLTSVSRTCLALFGSVESAMNILILSVRYEGLKSKILSLTALPATFVRVI